MLVWPNCLFQSCLPKCLVDLSSVGQSAQRWNIHPDKQTDKYEHCFHQCVNSKQHKVLFSRGLVEFWDLHLLPVSVFLCLNTSSISWTLLFIMLYDAMRASNLAAWICWHKNIDEAGQWWWLMGRWSGFSTQNCSYVWQIRINISFTVFCSVATEQHIIHAACLSKVLMELSWLPFQSLCKQLHIFLDASLQTAQRKHLEKNRSICNT